MLPNDHLIFMSAVYQLNTSSIKWLQIMQSLCKQIYKQAFVPVDVFDLTNI